MVKLPEFDYEIHVATMYDFPCVMESLTQQFQERGEKKKKKKETRNIEMYLTVMSFSVPPSRIDIEIGILITTC